LICLSLSDLFGVRTQDFKDNILSLEGEVMLSLRYSREVLGGKDRGPFMRHVLTWGLRGTAKYYVLVKRKDGREDTDAVDFVEGSGVVYPRTGDLIASIDLYLPSQISDFGDYVQRHDASKGPVFARFSELGAVWCGLNAEVSALESQVVSVRRVCPFAKSDREGPVEVSIQDFFAYFKGFNNDETHGLPNHYHSYDSRLGRYSDLNFVRGNTKVISLRDASSKNKR
jgi:hypothetical protein